MKPRKHTQPDRSELAWLISLKRALRDKELMARFKCGRSYLHVVSRETKQNACSVDLSDVIERCLPRRLK
jgi:hypothetical protein